MDIYVLCEGHWRLPLVSCEILCDQLAFYILWSQAVKVTGTVSYVFIETLGELLASLQIL